MHTNEPIQPAEAEILMEPAPKKKALRFKKDLKEDILRAYEQAGGVSYLVTIASLDPKAFLGLLAKVLPMQITGAPNGCPIKIEVITGVSRSPDDPLPLGPLEDDPEPVDDTEPKE